MDWLREIDYWYWNLLLLNRLFFDLERMQTKFVFCFFFLFWVFSLCSEHLIIFFLFITLLIKSRKRNSDNYSVLMENYFSMDFVLDYNDASSLFNRTINRNTQHVRFMLFQDEITIKHLEWLCRMLNIKENALLSCGNEKKTKIIACKGWEKKITWRII